jgi:Arf-GAP with SH3 domain, ANK repeat and PH domain-containing protein
MDPIDLRIASVREARNADRRFCFEVVTPNFTRVYQATSEEDMKSWIYTINNALQSAVEGGKNAGPVLDSPSGTGRKDFASALTGKSNSQRDRGGYGGGRMVGRHATVGDRPAHRPSPEMNNENSQKLLQAIRDADPANKYCADCNSESKVDWVSINLGVIICIECSGIHRSLGTHISKVRSLTLDPNAFTLDVIEILLILGNRKANAIWEAKPDASSSKPNPQATRDQRLRFITAKYTERAFVEKLSPTRSHFSTADETLLASIKKNDITEVAHALALDANPNVVDRSRGTHAVFLALAAADPASPSPGPSPPGSSRRADGSTAGLTGGTATTPTMRNPFPVAELLLLNGADLPIAPPPIPLSRAGRDYLEAKLEQKSGRRPTHAALMVPSSAATVAAAATAAAATAAASSVSALTTGGGSAATSGGQHGSVSAVSANATPSSGGSGVAAGGSTIHAVPPGTDETGGVGTGGDTLTALPFIGHGQGDVGRSPGERRKRLSSGGRLVKLNGPSS